MKTLSTGTLSSVTGAELVSGVSSPPIDISNRNNNNLSAWFSIEGDTGRTGGSIAVFWKGCYAKSAATYAMSVTGQYFIKSGTSVTGEFVNGTYLKNIETSMPFIRIAAVASASGSTQHGTGTTNSTAVKYAIAAV